MEYGYEDTPPEPSMRLNIGEEVFDATRSNTSLYAYQDELSCYDHIELEAGTTEDGLRQIICIFAGTAHFQAMADYMVRTGYQMVSGMPEVAAYVSAAYDLWKARSASEAPRADEEVPATSVLTEAEQEALGHVAASHTSEVLAQQTGLDMNRLLYAKWLVAQGILSEWDVTTPTADA